MIAIRPIRESEAEDFLQLLCDGFSIDFNRVYNAFFDEPLFELNRKWALFEGSEIVSILTTTPLEFGWGRAIGVAGVVTRANRRREGLAGRLLERVLRQAERTGESAALLFAQSTELYERAGFIPLDRVIRAPIALDLSGSASPSLPFASTREAYDRWAALHPDRLRRDERRWNWWQWHGREAVSLPHGYLVAEHGDLKEVLCFGPLEGSVPVMPGTEWVGLTQMADLLGLQFASARIELTLMGRNVPNVPQMWMTDQF